MLAHRLRSHHCREANGKGYHVALLKQTPKLQKRVCIWVLPQCFSVLSPMLRSCRNSEYFPLPGLPHVVAARYLCECTPVQNYKVDPLKTLAEGIGRYVVSGFGVLTSLLSAYLRSALTVGVYMCRAATTTLQPLLPPLFMTI